MRWFRRHGRFVFPRLIVPDPFQLGELSTLEKEYVDEAKTKLRSLYDLPAVTPFQLRADADIAGLQGLDWDHISEE